MAVMPGIKWDPLPENRTQPSITPTQIILHTAADGRGSETDVPGQMRSVNVGTESHFWVPDSGKIVQMMDTNRWADANRGANGRAISIETEDNTPGIGAVVPKWKPAQVAAIVEILEWATETHGIPAVRCPSKSATGIGWHTMWNFPGDPEGQTTPFVKGGWTNVVKTCPGPNRIRQLLDEILPQLNGQPSTPRPPVNPPSSTPLLERGSKGSAVRELQNFLSIGSDGDFGPVTEAAVKGFQVSQRLSPDGKVGTMTWRRIGKIVPAYSIRISNYLPYVLKRNSRDARNSSYKALVGRWREEMRLPEGTSFDSKADAATRGFQTGCKLTVDGIVGRKTWGTYFAGMKAA